MIMTKKTIMVNGKKLQLKEEDLVLIKNGNNYGRISFPDKPIIVKVLEIYEHTSFRGKVIDSNFRLDYYFLYEEILKKVNDKPKQSFIFR